MPLIVPRLGILTWLGKLLPNFVDEGCGLESLPRGKFRHSSSGEPAKLVVDQREEFLGGLRVTLVDGFDNLGIIRHEGSVLELLPLVKFESAHRIGSCRQTKRGQPQDSATFSSSGLASTTFLPSVQCPPRVLGDPHHRHQTLGWQVQFSPRVTWLRTCPRPRQHRWGPTKPNAVK